MISALPRGLVMPMAAAAGNAAFDLSGDKVEIFFFKQKTAYEIVM